MWDGMNGSSNAVSGGGASGHSHVSAARAEYGCQSDLTAGLPDTGVTVTLPEKEEKSRRNHDHV